MEPDLSMAFAHVQADSSSMDHVFLHVLQVLPELETNAEGVNLHVLNVQAPQLSVQIAWTHSHSFEAQEDAIKAQLATTVKFKTKLEGAKKYVVKTYSFSMECAYSADAQMGSEKTDLVAACQQQSQMVDAKCLF